MHSININDLLEKKGSLIIDIRNSASYYYGHIPGAINISERELLSNPSKYIDKKNTYYICCDSGRRSSSVVAYLNSYGYHCVNINGGYNNYLLSK